MLQKVKALLNMCQRQVHTYKQQIDQARIRNGQPKRKFTSNTKVKDQQKGKENQANG